MSRIAYSIILCCAVATASFASFNGTDYDDYQETVIFLKKQVGLGQNVFIRGGFGNVSGCLTVGTPYDGDPCAIPIVHLDLDMAPGVTALRDALVDSDDFLSWSGPEPNQNQGAEGTPAQITSSDQSQSLFQKLNKYGSDYWLVRVLMDCSELANYNGFFDVKGFYYGELEEDVSQGQCTGDAAETAPYTSGNHVARCGYINVFEWGSSNCRMESF
ncbi:alpha-amylase [Elysia marginata]|uniref:Alpha-amylase n=1 Tax=Elysia marginata TaxID=1093978 RepID=A0AAV4H628_9GAST|nr:alpha-amylase [Elysia marginata]